MRGRRVAAWLSAPLGYLRPRNSLVMQWSPGPVRLRPDVALFCHFAPDGTLRPDVARYLTELSAAGFSVVAVSNSGRLRPEALAALQSVCTAVLVRRNSGWDFTAWREAMERLALPRPDTERLLLANDSVHGPLEPLGPLLDRMDGSADVWGMTDSDELGWHLQSYFLLVGRAVLCSAAWRRFWRGVRPMPSKLLTVLWFEIGLSRCLLRAGFRLRALFPDHGCGPAGTNPTLASWRTLRQAGFPFVKRAVLQNEPEALGNSLLDAAALGSRPAQTGLTSATRSNREKRPCPAITPFRAANSPASALPPGRSSTSMR